MFPTNGGGCGGGPLPRRGKSGKARNSGGGSEPRAHPNLQLDRVRMEAYKDAIFHHQKQIAGKVVVDVGCGTGILSIFCAQAGARKVYAVDASDIALQASKVVKANNLSDTIIVLKGRVEDVKIDEKADVIISEWMGYMLFYESMLGAVITARDKWLNPGGLMLPSHATLYMAPISNPKRYNDVTDFWRDVYGIDMSAMIPLAKDFAFQDPSVEIISVENVLSPPHVVKHIDCSTVTIQELESVNTEFVFKGVVDLNALPRVPLNGFGFWFDVKFDDALTLSTAPDKPPTHWQQTITYFSDPVDVEVAEDIHCSVTLSQSKENPRFMTIRLKYEASDGSFVKVAVMR